MTLRFCSIQILATSPLWYSVSIICVGFVSKPWMTLAYRSTISRMTAFTCVRRNVRATSGYRDIVLKYAYNN